MTLGLSDDSCAPSLPAARSRVAVNDLRMGFAVSQHSAAVAPHRLSAIAASGRGLVSSTRKARIFAMRRAAAALAGLAALGAAGQGSLRPQPYPGPFDEYLCKPQLADDAGHAWAFDMTPVATANFSFVNVPLRYSFIVAGCGVLDSPCLPGWDVEWTYAPVLQFFAESLGSGTTCWDPAANATAPCTNQCEALARGAPQWSLLDASNASAGLSVTFASVFEPPGGHPDPMQCPFDPVFQTASPRTVVINYACDPTVPAGQIVAGTAVEGPTCTYTVTASTAAACPTRSTTKALLPPPSVPAVPEGGNTEPYAPYLCQPVLADAAGYNWAFNFTGLYRAAGSEYSFAIPDRNTSYSLNVCGYSSALCAPYQYQVQSNWGAATMFWGAPGQPDTNCSLINNGTIVPCTMNCEVLAAGAPVWNLLDATNGKSGGVALQYWGLTRLSFDPFSCPVTKGGTEMAMGVYFNIACDPAAKELVISTVEEASPCTYTVVAAAAAACGVRT